MKSLCYHCATSGVCQFGIIEQIFDDQPSRSHGRIRCPPNFQGLPGMVHGGWIAAVFDDFMGRQAWTLGEFVHTTSLTIDFIKPAPVGPELHFSVFAQPLETRTWRADAELRVAETSLLVAKATGRFVQPRRRGGET